MPCHRRTSMFNYRAINVNIHAHLILLLPSRLSRRSIGSLLSPLRYWTPIAAYGTHTCRLHCQQSYSIFAAQSKHDICLHGSCSTHSNISERVGNLKMDTLGKVLASSLLMLGCSLNLFSSTSQQYYGFGEEKHRAFAGMCWQQPELGDAARCCPHGNVASVY